jgi:hypothetical protein
MWNSFIIAYMKSQSSTKPKVTRIIIIKVLESQSKIAVDNHNWKSQSKIAVQKSQSKIAVQKSQTKITVENRSRKSQLKICRKSQSKSQSATKKDFLDWDPWWLLKSKILGSRHFRMVWGRVAPVRTLNDPLMSTLGCPLVIMTDVQPNHPQISMRCTWPISARNIMGCGFEHGRCPKNAALEKYLCLAWWSFPDTTHGCVDKQDWKSFQSLPASIILVYCIGSNMG